MCREEGWCLADLLTVDLCRHLVFFGCLGHYNTLPVLSEPAGTSSRLLWQGGLSGFGRGEWVHSTVMLVVLLRCSMVPDRHVMCLSCFEDGELR